MDTKKLYSYITLCGSDNFSQAADQLFMAQSSLSAQIASLEEEFGAQFIVRNKKSGIELTKEGKDFLEFSKWILGEYENIKKDFAKRSEKQIITIGIFYSKRIESWANKISVFNSQHDDVSYSLSIMYGKDKSDALLKGNIDIGLCQKIRELDESGLNYSFFLNNKILFGVPFSNPLSIKEELTIDDLKNQSILVIRKERTKTAELTIHWLIETLGISEKKIIQCNTIDDISLALVTKADSLAFLPKDMLSSLKYVSLQGYDPLQLEYGWYYKKDSPYTQWVINNLK